MNIERTLATTSSPDQLNNDKAELSKKRRDLVLNVLATIALTVIGVAALVFLWPVSIPFSLGMAAPALGGAVYIAVTTARTYLRSKG